MMLVDYHALNRTTAVAAMTRLERELFGRHAWDERTVTEELDAPARTYIFDINPTYDDGRPHYDAAFAAAIPESAVRGFAGYWYDGEDAEIMDIGVGKTHQRQGIAEIMMRHLIEQARAQGARRMLLEVSVENNAAMTLYRKLGFQRIGLRRRYYQPEGIDALVMALDLTPHIIGFATTQPQPSDMAKKEQAQ